MSSGVNEKAMNLLFLSIVHISDINVRGIYTDLMRKFRNEGHQVYIVTPLERRSKLQTSLTIQDGVNILGVRTLNVQKTNLVEKGIGTLLIEYQYQKAISKYWSKIEFDLILYSTPPITFTRIVKKLKRKYNALSYLLLKDIFPQNAVDLGLFSKRSLFYLIFRHKEKQLYKISDYIGCMSPANVNFILSHNPYLIKEIVEENPNSVELSKKEELDRSLIRKKYNLPLELPIFIYGGNLGKPQGLDFLMQILDKNRNRKDCYFLIVGSGTEYRKINNWFQKNNIPNALLLKGLSRGDYDQLVKSCDVGLIFLDPRFTIPNYPSRLLAYLENRMPILAATDVITDIGKIAETQGYGFWCENGDIDAFNEKLTLLLDKEIVKRMGECGYNYLVNNYLVDHSYQIIMEHLLK